jgi:Thymidylate synthase
MPNGKSKSADLLIVQTDSAFDAYRSAFLDLYTNVDRLSSDPELLRESPGQLLIRLDGGFASPLEVRGNRFVGDFNYDSFVARGEIIFSVVRSHYERILLSSGSLNQVVKLLSNRPMSKRGIADVWAPAAATNQTPCLVYLWFRVDGDQLHCHAHMRANDVYRKLLMNLHLLLAAHAWVAHSLSLQQGQYLHYCDSLHFYKINDREIERTSKLLSSYKLGPQDNVLADRPVC